MRRTDEEFAEAMRHLLYDHEPETPEEVAAFLRSEGLDPDAIASQGRLWASLLLRLKRLEMRLETLEGGVEACARLAIRTSETVRSERLKADLDDAAEACRRGAERFER